MREHQESTVLVNTADFNKYKYTHSDYIRVVDARKLQNIIGAPTYSYFRTIIKDGNLRNCPIMQLDAVAAKDIWEPNLQIIKGRATRHKPMHLRSYITKFPWLFYKNTNL